MPTSGTQTKARDVLVAPRRRAIMLLHQAGGVVEEESGRATYVWLRMCPNPWNAAGATMMARHLDQEGVIDRELDRGGKRTYRIELNYTHPHVIRTLQDEGYATTARLASVAAMSEPQPEDDAEVFEFPQAPERPEPIPTQMVTLDAAAFAHALLDGITTRFVGPPPTSPGVTLETAAAAGQAATVGATKRELEKATKKYGEEWQRAENLQRRLQAADAAIRELQGQRELLERNLATAMALIPGDVRETKWARELRKLMETPPLKGPT